MRGLLLSIFLLLFAAGCNDDLVFFTVPTKEKIAEPPEDPVVQAQQTPDMGSSDSGLPAPERRHAHGEFTEPVKSITLKGITLQIPARYTEQTAFSSMRLAQYSVPPTDGGEAADFTIFYFGVGQGGSAADNAGRWLRQFKAEGGASPITSYTTDSVAGLTITRLTLEGTWSQPAMGPNAPAQEPKSGWAMDALVVEGGPEGSLFLRFTGPAALLRKESPVIAAIAENMKSTGPAIQTPPPRELKPLDTNVGTVPENQRPNPGAPAAPDTPMGGIGLQWKAPEGWQQIPTESPLRAAEFHKAGKDGENLEAIVFHFGAAGGGTAEDNIRRWVGQVTQADGSSSDLVAKNKNWSANGLKFTRVDVTGTYKQTAMGPGAPASGPRENYALVGVVVEGGPAGSIYVRITGPQELIKSESDHIDEFLKSIEVRQNGTQ